MYVSHSDFKKAFIKELYMNQTDQLRGKSQYYKLLYAEQKSIWNLDKKNYNTVHLKG